MEMIDEIKFACATCGQHIVTAAEAAGVAVECPSCRETMTVPAARAIHDRSYGEGLRGSDALTESRENLEAVVSECERLKSVATHAQAELKTFQAERLGLKSELAQLRQRHSGLEEKAAALEAESARREGAAAAREAALTQDLAIARTRASAAETQISAKESDLENAHAALTAAEAQGRAIKRKSWRFRTRA